METLEEIKPVNRLKRNGGKQKEVDMAISVPAMNIETINIRVVGDSSLVCHAWDQKVKQEMLDKQMKKAKTARAVKDPESCFRGSMYYCDNGKPGFPAVGFKSAAVDACSHVEGVTKVEARGAFHLVGNMVEIEGTPEMRQDMVRVGMGAADIRFRAEFKTWAAVLTVRYNANVLSAEQIMNLFNTAGFAIGVGEWRPQKNGSWGMFHVATMDE